MTALVWVSCTILSAVVFAANNHPTAHGEQTETDTIHFYYDQHMIRMMREWMGILSETKVYHDDVSLPMNVQHWCGQHDIYLLERNVTYSASTPPSAISG